MTMRSMTRGTGARGGVGNPGPSAYEVATSNGFVGTEAQWLASLEGADGADGPQGPDGLSAYEVAVANGFVGTESAWLASLVGPPGTTDHGAQSGLADDDHTQYALADGTRGAFAPTSHTHTASQVTDFATAADARIAAHVALGDPHSQYALDTDLTAHTGDATDAHAASAITNTPAGGIAATTVQGAINELDTEKAATSHTHTASAITPIATSRILGRVTAGSGATEELTSAQAKTILALTSADISDLAEFIRDTVAATLVQGANVTITVDDPGDAITIAAAGGGGGGGLTQQQVMAIGALRP